MAAVTRPAQPGDCAAPATTSQEFGVPAGHAAAAVAACPGVASATQSDQPPLSTPRLPRAASAARPAAGEADAQPQSSLHSSDHAAGHAPQEAVGSPHGTAARVEAQLCAEEIKHGSLLWLLPPPAPKDQAPEHAGGPASAARASSPRSGNVPSEVAQAAIPPSLASPKGRCMPAASEPGMGRQGGLRKEPPVPPGELQPLSWTMHGA